MKFVNLTPSPLTIVGDGESFDLPVDGPAPLLAIEKESLGTVPIDFDGFSSLLDQEFECLADIPICASRGFTCGLPEPQDGVLLIVPATIAEHSSLLWREDLASPGEVISDAGGRIRVNGLCAGLGLARQLRHRQ